MTLNQIKKFLRDQILKQRKELTREEAISKSREITRALKKLPEYQVARTVCVYVSSKDNEVDTLELIQQMVTEGKRVAVPVTRLKERRLELSLIDDVSRLVRRTFDILEPLEEEIRPVAASEIDLFIVPGVVFDKAGFRIGMGGGFYDRLLSGVSGVPVVGLAYDFQVVRSLPAMAIDEHDRPVNIILTEFGAKRVKGRQPGHHD